MLAGGAGLALWVSLDMRVAKRRQRTIMPPKPARNGGAPASVTVWRKAGT